MDFLVCTSLAHHSQAPEGGQPQADPPPPPWYLKMMTLHAVSVQNKLNLHTMLNQILQISRSRAS